MSWQLASLAIVLGALALAFWWYERSRPSAKLVAVVATLGALAALGRDAFAAVPDVKPITAIVLVSGLSFGAGPGFAVGAISGLASNILLGQGPWTPWQMLGWGLVGLIGEGLSRLLGPRPSRLSIAVACALAAEAFNLVMDLSVWTAAGNHSLAAFEVILGAALVFDLTHVLASFGFGLAFGAVLARMLRRVQSRLHVDWQPGPAAPSPAHDRITPRALAGPMAMLAALLTLGGAALLTGSVRARAAGAPASAAHVAVAREVAYLRRAQNSDGGFGPAPGSASSELYTAWAAMGLAAGGQSPQAVSRSGHTVLDALRAEASSLQGAGDLERTILALRAAGASTGSLPGGDPVARLLKFRSADGSFGHLANQTAFAILALRAGGYAPHNPVVAGAWRWLVSQQEANGGFGFATKGGGSDIDDTAAVLQALAVAGRGSTVSAGRAARYLLGAQNPDGGFPQEPRGASNAQSTSWAVQGLLAAGRNPAAARRDGSRSPLGYLESLEAPDGSIRYSRTGAQTPVWVTAQAITALAEKPLPIAPVPARGAARVPVPAVHAVLSSARATPEPVSGIDASTRALRALLSRVLGFLER